ncbi:MAG: T9SS type A sorting domain-containing protein [Gammaproteobacteria bacterium]|nr:T9SS type A sorting domain-containing protein [Gammaproteobacteria bacterium]
MASSADPPAMPPQQPRDDNLLILGLKVDYTELEDVVPVYRADDQFYIPLGILSQILGLAIKIDLGTASADGFILDESRQFHLNAGGREVIISGVRQVVPQFHVFIYPDDIYVNMKTLQQWWPMDFEVNLFNSQLLIKTREKLPFQRKLQREKEMGKILNRYRPKAKNFPQQDSEYQLLSPPFIDHKMSASRYQQPDGSSKDAYSYTTHIKADVLYHETSLYLRGNEQEKLESKRVYVSRTDPDNRLLGYMNASRYAFWNINLPSSEYIAASQSNVTGAMISSFPLRQQTQYDRHTFEGELLPDWEVELYHNNALLAYQDKAVDGQYRFEDIPLLFGHNYFKLVFYGPHGETREETHTFSLTGDLVKPGSYHYYLTVAEDDETEFQRGYLLQNFGLSKYFSGQFNLFSIPVTDNISGLTTQHQYTDIALNGFIGSLFYRLNHVSDLDGGNLQEVSLQNRFGRTNLSASHTVFSDFISERFQSTDQIVSRSKYRLDTALPAWWLPVIPITFGVTRDEYASGGERIEYINRLSLAARGLALTNSMTRTESTVSDTIETGLLQISNHSNMFSLRSEFYYQTKPEKKLTSVVLNFAGKFLRPYQFNVGVTKFETDEYQYLLGLNKQFGNYAFQASTTYKTTGERAIDLSFAISFGRDPRRRKWHAQAQPLASTGSTSIHVFFDKNQNGRRDEGEEGLPKIGFRFNDSVRTERTDENGVVLVTGLHPYDPMDLSIDMETLVDPLMEPASPGVRIVPRAGHIEQINIPVILTGEIDGIVYIHRQGKEYPVGDVEIELYDMQGKLVKSTRSAYDGFYLLSKIPAGKYYIKMSSTQAATLGLLETVPRELTINPEDPFISNLNFVIFEDKDAAAKKPKPGTQ